MDPTTTFCPNMACPASGHMGQGNLGVHSRTDQRCMGTPCRKTCTATQGPACDRLRTAAETVTLGRTLPAQGCPLQAIVLAFGCDERTVADWGGRAGNHGQAVQEHLVEQPRDLGQVQADALCVKTQGGIVWMAVALLVQTRLWRGDEVSAQRTRSLIRRLIERGRRWAAHRPRLVGTDGVVSYSRAMWEPLRAPVPTGKGGRP